VVGIASAVLFLLVLWRMAGLVRQISQQAAKLDELSTTDALTGLANRRRWDAELQTAVARAQRSIGCDGAKASMAIEQIRAVTPKGETCSAGIAALGRTETPADVVARADAALYRAKAVGLRYRAVDATAKPGERATPRAASERYWTSAWISVTRTACVADIGTLPKLPPPGAPVAAHVSFQSTVAVTS